MGRFKGYPAFLRGLVSTQTLSQVVDTTDEEPAWYFPFVNEREIGVLNTKLRKENEYRVSKPIVPGLFSLYRLARGRYDHGL